MPDRAEGFSKGEPLTDGQGLRTAIGVDANLAEGRLYATGVDRQLAREHVVDHLAPFTERGLDQPPETVLRLRVEPIVGVVRLHHDDR